MVNYDLPKSIFFSVQMDCRFLNGNFSIYHTCVSMLGMVYPVGQEILKVCLFILRLPNPALGQLCLLCSVMFVWLIATPILISVATRSYSHSVFLGLLGHESLC